LLPASTRSIAASSSCFCRCAQRQISSLDLPACARAARAMGADIRAAAASADARSARYRPWTCRPARARRLGVGADIRAAAAPAGARSGLALSLYLPACMPASHCTLQQSLQQQLHGALAAAVWAPLCSYSITQSSSQTCAGSGTHSQQPACSSAGASMHAGPARRRQARRPQARALTLGSLATTPVPEQGASRSTRSTVRSPSTRGSSRPS